MIIKCHELKLEIHYLGQQQQMLQSKLLKQNSCLIESILVIEIAGTFMKWFVDGDVKQWIEWGSLLLCLWWSKKTIVIVIIIMMMVTFSSSLKVQYLQKLQIVGLIILYPPRDKCYTKNSPSLISTFHRSNRNDCSLDFHSATSKEILLFDWWDFLFLYSNKCLQIWWENWNVCEWWWFLFWLCFFLQWLRRNISSLLSHSIFFMPLLNSNLKMTIPRTLKERKDLLHEHLNLGIAGKRGERKQ